MSSSQSHDVRASTAEEPSATKKVRFAISPGKGAGDTPPGDGGVRHARSGGHGRRQPAVAPLRKQRKSSIAGPRDKSASILEAFRAYWGADVIPDKPLSSSPPKSSYRFVFDDDTDDAPSSTLQAEEIKQQSSSQQEGGMFGVIPLISAIVAKGFQKLSQSSQPSSQHSPLTQRDPLPQPSTP